VETLRLGRRTKAINATQSPIPIAKKFKNNLFSILITKARDFMTLKTLKYACIYALKIYYNNINNIFTLLKYLLENYYFLNFFLKTIYKRCIYR